MAVATGSSALSTDLRSWYTSLNTIISKYSNGVAQMTVPAAYKTIQATDVNTYYTKLTALKSDYYLKYATYPPTTATAAVSVGALIKPFVNAAASGYLGNVKCKNIATNSKGSNNHGTKSNGSNTNGSDGNFTPQWYHYNQFNSNGGNSNGYVGEFLFECSQSSFGNGSNGNGAQTANGTCSNTKVVDIFCTQTTKSNNG